MRRIAFIALVAAAGCGEVTELAPGPTDRFYFPTGLAVHAGKLVVASSNFDLRYDADTGGTLIAVDPSADPATRTGAINLRSFTGELAVADPATCPIRTPELGAIAVLPVRGVGFVYQVRVADDGTLTCEDCATQVGTTNFADPFAVGLACGPGIARAYVGHLRSAGVAWMTQIDLTRDPSEVGAVQHLKLGTGVFRGFAYDPVLERLYATRTVTGSSTSLRWVDLGGGCSFDATEAPVCATGETVSGAIPNGLELRAIALASPPTDGSPQRAYLTARIYDPVLAATAGTRIGDFDGLLLVADLVETLHGQLDLEIVEELPLGYGAAEVAVLRRSGGGRDVVAALASDSGTLLVHDDETGEDVYVLVDELGVPRVGRQPFGFAVDPTGSDTDGPRLYVGSFEDGFVTPIDVPLDDIGALALRSRITGGTTP